ncbi:MAG: hypothetical protein HY302_03365 [Opitutae bacterium]|nr:hypothetical protein [Opitutae bacterium]
MDLDEPTLNELRADVRRTSLGGCPMLGTAAVAWTLCGAATYLLPAKTAALVFLFQGTVTMPVGLWLLPRWLGLPPLPRAHPLTPLLVQCAGVQALMLPAVIAVYAAKPALVPMAFAAIMGGHFLPYWWLQRTKAYLFGALACALGPWVLTLFVGAENSFHFTGFFVGACLAMLALKVRSEARRGALS